MVTFKRTSELGYRQDLVGELYIHGSSLQHLHTCGWGRDGELDAESDGVEAADTGPDFPEGGHGS